MDGLTNLAHDRLFLLGSDHGSRGLVEIANFDGVPYLLRHDEMQSELVIVVRLHRCLSQPSLVCPEDCTHVGRV